MLTDRSWKRLIATVAFALLVGVTTALTTSAAPANTTYAYDAAGRIISVTYVNGSTIYVIKYAYDASGNRSSTVTTPAAVWGGFQWGSAYW